MGRVRCHNNNADRHADNSDPEHRVRFFRSPMEMTETTAATETAPPNTTGITIWGIAPPPLNIASVRLKAPQAPKVPAANPQAEPLPVKEKVSPLYHIPINPPAIAQTR